LLSSFAVFMLFSFLESWVTVGKRGVLEVGDRFFSAMCFVFFLPLYVCIVSIWVVHYTLCAIPAALWAIHSTLCAWGSRFATAIGLDKFCVCMYK